MNAMCTCCVCTSVSQSSVCLEEQRERSISNSLSRQVTNSDYSRPKFLFRMSNSQSVPNLTLDRTQFLDLSPRGYRMRSRLAQWLASERAHRGQDNGPCKRRWAILETKSSPGLEHTRNSVFRESSQYCNSPGMIRQRKIGANK